MQKIILSATLIFLITGACTIFRTPAVEYDTIPPTRNRNVCKHLQDTVLVYAIFVDAGSFHVWTEFDIKTTMDSLQKATNWISNQASFHDKKVGFSIVRHEQSGKWSIREPRKKRKAQPWADRISRIAGRGTKYTPSGKMGSRLRITDRQTLIQALRDKYERENVALLFFVNGYYEDHPSSTYYSATNGPQTEFSFITNKNPAVIAHELLHLFGAIDLYPTINYPNFNYQKLSEVHPDEVMRVQHKEISKLNISPVTAYFVGWQDTLDAANMHLLLHKKELIDY